MDGIAYGFDDIDRAKKTRSNMIEQVQKSEEINILSMQNFIKTIKIMGF